MKEIELHNGMLTRVSDEDYAELNQYHWYATYSRLNDKWYAVRIECQDGRRTRHFMHKQVLGLAKGQQGDHKDHDPLNNQRDNLRPATHAQNSANRRKRRGTSSPYIGVSRFREAGFIAQIHAQGVKYYLGLYRDEQEAARVRDAKARELHGEFAVLNFPLPDEGLTRVSQAA